MSKTTNKFSLEVHERAVQILLEQELEYSSRWAAAGSTAGKICCSVHALMEWVKRADIESGRSAGVPLEVSERLKELERVFVCGVRH